MKRANRSRRRKYGEAIEILRVLVAGGADRAPDGSLLTPAAIKKLRASFSDIPGSTWRKAVSDARNEMSCMPSMAASNLTVPSGVMPPTAANYLAASAGLNCMVTSVGAGEPTRAAAPAVRADGSASDAESSSSSGSDTGTVSNNLRPIYVMGVWESDEEDKRVSIAILMPSGLCARQKDHDVRIVAEGQALEVTVVWPRALTDVVYLHKYWIDKQPGFLQNHPRLISFRAFLRRFRSNNRQEITSTFRLKLPFKVKTELTVVKRNTSYLSWTNSSEIVLYITLEAPDANYLADEEALPIFSKS